MPFIPSAKANGISDELHMKNLSKIESFDIPVKDADKTLVAEHTFFKEPPEEYRNVYYSIYYTDED